MYFLSEIIAFRRLEPQCPLSLTSIINENDTQMPEVLDFDPTTCLLLGEVMGQWMQISFPYVMIKGPFYMSLLGDLKCSPTFGLSVSVISDCESSSTCSYSQCIASDLVTSDGLVGCKYRCHSFSVSIHITVDIAGFSAATRNGTLCEIVF